MYNENKIIDTLTIVQDTCFNDLNSLERMLVISNLLLIEAENYLPEDLKKDAKSLLSNGKRISYELLKHEDNVGLNFALKAHYLISDIHKEIEGGNSFDS